MAFKLKKQDAAELQKLIDAYESARSSLADALDEIASEWETDFADKSERWQEGDVGQEIQAKIEMVRGWFDEFPTETDIDVESLL